MNKIILASQSPRRKQLLEWAELPFEVVVQETDERFPPGMIPEEVAIYIARNKAFAVQQLRNKDEIILPVYPYLFLQNLILIFLRNKFIQFSMLVLSPAFHCQ